jgi:type II secretory pathway component PulF
MAWTLSLVSKTSMDVRKAVGLALRGTNSSYYSRFEPAVVGVISSGRPIHEALRSTEVFPRQFVDTIEAGEDAGKLVTALEHLSNEYEQRGAAMSAVLTKLATMATWLIVSMIIIFFIFRIAAVYIGAINDAAAGF